MKKSFEDENIVIYLKTESDSQNIEVVTTDGEKQTFPVPCLFELGFGLGESLCFINPNTGDVLCGGDGEIMLISVKSNKLVYNDKVWSLGGLAVHLQSKYPESKCPDATPYDFFTRDTNFSLCKESLMNLYNNFFEKKYGIEIKKNRFQEILEHNRKENKKDGVSLKEFFEDECDNLTLASDHDWKYAKRCEWSLKHTKFSGHAESFRDMFKQVLGALHAQKPNVLNDFIFKMLSENDLLFRPLTKEIFDATGKQKTVVNGSLNGIDISTAPFNQREIENYADNMWIEVVPNLIYVWGLYSNNDMVKQIKKVFDLYGVHYGDLIINLLGQEDNRIKANNKNAALPILECKKFLNQIAPLESKVMDASKIPLSVMSKAAEDKDKHFEFLTLDKDKYLVVRTR